MIEIRCKRCHKFFVEIDGSPDGMILKKTCERCGHKNCFTFKKNTIIFKESDGSDKKHKECFMNA